MVERTAEEVRAEYQVAKRQDTADRECVVGEFALHSSDIADAMDAVGRERGLSKTVGVDRATNKYYSTTGENGAMLVHAIAEVQTDIRDQISLGEIRSVSEYEPLTDGDYRFFSDVFRI